MSLCDATALRPGALLEAEVAVVGAGPAGLALSTALAAAGVEVVLLEAGGLAAVIAHDEDSVRSTDGESAGIPPGDRRFGGTRWYGRVVVPDALDFEPRPWVAESGWPIPFAEIERHLGAASRWLGIPRPRALDPAFWRDEAAWRLLDGGGLEPRIHLISPVKDLGARFRRSVARDRRIAAFTGAALVGFDFAATGSHIERARLAADDGAERAIRARHFVLACGALENARQLLLLEEAAPGRLGPTGALGSGLFDHPRCDGVARLHLPHDARDTPALYRRLVEHTSSRAGCRMQLAVGLAPERQRAESLLNPCGFFYPVSAHPVAELGAAARELLTHLRAGRLAGGDLHRAGFLFARLPLVLAAAAARARGRPHALSHLALVEQLEQTRAEAGRVELAAERDRFGRRRLRVDWSVGEETRSTQRRFHQLLGRRLAANGGGRLVSPLLEDGGHVPLYGSAAHPMGTTRMSADPSRGAVDTHCRVHAVDNLFALGSSVIPTSGNANPTLTIVALALRLASHLGTL